MSFKQVIERVRFWIQHRHRTDELEEEIRLHLDLRIQRNLENGMTQADARTTAVRRFGDPTRVREAATDVWISRWLDDLWQDLKFGARWLKRSPGFTAIIVATLGVGIGVNTAMFSVINSVLLQPLPYPAPDRLIWIANSDPGCSGDCFNSRADFAIWAREAQSLEAAAAYGNLDLALVADGQSTAQRVAFVTPELWRLSGAIPRLGRLPNANEPTALIISWALFERQFRGNPNVIGKAVQLDGHSFEVVGVLDRGFRFLFPQQLYTGDEIRDIDAYAPLPNGIETPGDAMRATPQTGPVPGWVRVVARLKDGATIEQARSQLATIHDRLNKEYSSLFRKKKLVVLPLAERIVGEARLALLVLLSAVSFVLVIACVNVANLLMARASARRKEIAIRAALGAGKRRVMRQFIAEALLLGVLGGFAGLVLARLGLVAIIHFGAQAVPRVADTVMDSNVLAFAILVTLATAVLFGLAPARTVGKENLEEVLREEGRGASSSATQQRLRATLVSVEIALAMVLLTGAGLMMRSFWRMNTYPPGFSPEKVLVMKLSLAGGKYSRYWPAQDIYLMTDAFGH
jgi:predicted permease